MISISFMDSEIKTAEQQLKNNCQIWNWLVFTNIRGATQKFGEFDHKKKLITLTPIFHRLLRSSPLGHVYSDPSVSFHGSMHPWKFSSVSVLSTSCDSAWISSIVSKRRPFSRNFILGNKKKSQVRGQANRGVGNDCRVFGNQELSNE
jgi:hypothetical protein